MKDEIKIFQERGKVLLQCLQKNSSSQSKNFSNVRSLNKNYQLSPEDFFLYQIHELTFEEKAPRREAMENILGAFRGINRISFIYLIMGNRQGVQFYFGVANDNFYNNRFDQKNFNNLNETSLKIGRDILGPSIKGNFRGCRFEEIANEEKKLILQKLQSAKAVGMIEGVPGSDENAEDFQGVDRLIDVMAGDDFGFLVIARPYNDFEINELEKNLFELSDLLAPLAHYTLQRSESEGRNKNHSTNITKSESSGTSTQNNSSDSRTTNESKGNDERVDNSNQSQTFTSESASDESSHNEGYSESNSNNKYSASDSSSARYTVQNQISTSKSRSESKSNSSTKNQSTSTTKSNSTQNSKSDSKTTSDSDITSKVNSDSLTRIDQMEFETSTAISWIKYINEVLQMRIDYGRGKGIFSACSYIFSRERTTLYRLANTAVSLYSGGKGNRSALHFRELEKNDLLYSLQNMQIPFLDRNSDDHDQKICNTCLSNCSLSLGSWLSSKELAILAGLPKKEVPGLALREEVEFGLNVETSADGIKLGKLIQSGEEKAISVFIDKSALDKHIFVTGVTGSGKTTTCQNILLDSKMPFLVIEPAKTEYRILKDKCPDLIFFTPGRQDIAPFFLNPFELFPGEAITSRVDMLKATMKASFDMEAAIPQIMETAMYKAYEMKGWNIHTNSHSSVDDPFSNGVYVFPTLNDFLEAIKLVTESQGFDDRLKNDYIGSIRARVESLIVGAKGMMLNTPRSIDFYDLVNRKVVIELEEIKSGEEKSLLMGFILTNLQEAIKKRHRENNNFRHITLVEEAHRLLSRYIPGDSMNKKQGVEVFADMLAEVRKYGESLIISDQIPDKMTPEVLKNTNTKIVHKLFARDDKDAIGDTMALDDDQKEFLSKLPPGRSIMFSQGWSKAIQVQIIQQERTDRKEIDSETIHQLAVQYYSEPKNLQRGILRGIEEFQNVSASDVDNYLWLMRYGDQLIKTYRKIILNGEIKDDEFNFLCNEIRRINKKISERFWLNYLYKNSYDEDQPDRKEIFYNCMRTIARDEQAKPLILRKEMDYLKLQI